EVLRHEPARAAGGGAGRGVPDVLVHGPRERGGLPGVGPPGGVAGGPHAPGVQGRRRRAGPPVPPLRPRGPLPQGRVRPRRLAMTEPPQPVLLNTWKHHAGWIRWRVAEAAGAGAAGVAALPREMLVVGARLMDLYTGPLTPAEIG